MKKRTARKIDRVLMNAKPLKTGLRVGAAYSATGLRAGKGKRVHKATGEIHKKGIEVSYTPHSMKHGFYVGAGTAAGLKAYQVGRQHYGKTHSSTGKR